jgi:hypothetical protein
MVDRKQFTQEISQLNLTREEQAIALLWYYRHTQAFEERTASELASDLAEEHLGRPNVTVLHRDLSKSKQTVKGKRPKSFQLHTKFVSVLDDKYGHILQLKKVDLTPSVIPDSLVQATRPLLESMVRQINGCYNAGFFDASAVLIRRLIESLIIEVFIHNRLVQDIRVNNSFLMLDKLIVKICSHAQIQLGRNTPATLDDIKTLGDTAAHDRTYVTPIEDIDQLKLRIRHAVTDLLAKANLQPPA